MPEEQKKRKRQGPPGPDKDGEFFQKKDKSEFDDLDKDVEERLRRNEENTKKREKPKQ